MFVWFALYLMGFEDEVAIIHHICNICRELRLQLRAHSIYNGEFGKFGKMVLMNLHVYLFGTKRIWKRPKCFKVYFIHFEHSQRFHSHSFISKLHKRSQKNDIVYILRISTSRPTCSIYFELLTSQSITHCIIGLGDGREGTCKSLSNPLDSINGVLSKNVRHFLSLRKMKHFNSKSPTHTNEMHAFMHLFIKLVGLS